MRSNLLRIQRHGALLLTAWLAGTAGAADKEIPAPTAGGKETSAPPTHSMTRTAAKGKAQLDAVFEAMEMTPVKLEPKVWADLTVAQAVAHGTRVKKGELLVKLETDKLKEQIDDLEQDRPAAMLALELAVAELENLQQTTPLKLEAAKRTRRVADEDMAYFDKTGRGQREKAARFSVKNAEQRLDGAKEELKQLEKMYRADDLTEETEEIVLRRQRFAVESAEYGLEVAKLGSELSLKTGIPREEEVLKTQKRDQGLALALAEETLPRNLAKKRFEVEKLKRDQKKAGKRLTDLRNDLESLMVRAPSDGVVYYGACEGGRWTTGAAVAKKLVPGGKLTANEIIMTVVKPERVMLKAVVPESDLAQFKQGMEGKASPVSAPDQKFEVKLEEIGLVPLPGGGFEAGMSVPKRHPARLMPGMNCKVVFGEAQKAEVLLAPKEAVFVEDGQSHVFVLKGDGTSEKRAVKTGESEGKMVEILQGLAEGEKILLSRPQSETTGKAGGLK